MKIVADNHHINSIHAVPESLPTPSPPPHKSRVSPPISAKKKSAALLRGEVKIHHIYDIKRRERREEKK